MMRLSTLWAVHGTRSAADEPGPLAQQIAERWEHDRDSLRFVRSSANSVYRFDAAGTRRFLRFASGAERTQELIEAEVELLEWLVGRGAAVARPAPSKAGRLVETVTADVGVYYAVAFDRLEGEQLEIGHLDRHRFERWGAALGRLHATVDDYGGSALESRPSWREQLHGARASIPEQESVVRRELDAITAALEALPADRGRCGLIHGDFMLDNLRWTDDGDGAGATAGTVGMLDFDDCARHWYAADIAFVLRDRFDAGAGLGDEWVDTFLRGYQTHRPLHAEPLAALPLFSRLSRLLSYTTNVRTLDLPDSADHPEWLRGLRRAA